MSVFASVDRREVVDDDRLEVFEHARQYTHRQVRWIFFLPGARIAMGVSLAWSTL